MIERQLVIPAPQDEVWKALTDPDLVALWFGAQVEWELTPGAPARFADDDGSQRAGRIEEVTAGALLRFRWWPSGSREGDREGDASEVAYRLEPHPDGTHLTITERRLTCRPEEAASSEAMAGWAMAGWTAWDGRLIGLWSRLDSCLFVDALLAGGAVSVIAS
ncbi:MAG: SRPBCC domain-containing protein [Actinomycetota bacterium]|nr:SRPBCC domain-containing protein [Actinomycetota bacterium]